MKMPILVLFAFAVTLNTARSQDVRPPLPETTISVGPEEISQGLKSVEELNGMLKALGDPSKKLGTETDNEYLDRVDVTIKGRAFLIHQLHQEIEKALLVRYRMEDAFEEYRNWSQAVNESLKTQPDNIKREIEDFEKSRNEYAADVVVLVQLLQEQAKQENNEIIMEELEASWGTESEVKEAILDIDDATSRREKFEALASIEQKQTALSDLLGQDEEAAIELSLLKAGLGEAERFAQELPTSHKAVFTELTSTLEAQKASFRKLEKMATSLSVLARLTKNNLRYVRQEGFVKNGALSPQEEKSLQLSEAQMGAAFDVFQGNFGASGLLQSIAPDGGKQFLSRVKKGK